VSGRWHAGCICGGKAQRPERGASRETGPGSGLERDAAPDRRPAVLWTLIVILIILWLLGFTVLHVGSLIHILLVLALVVLIYQLITGRRAL